MEKTGLERVERNDRILERARLSERYDELSSKGISNLTKEEHKEIREISKKLEEVEKQRRKELNEKATKEFHKLLARSKELGFH